MKKISPSFMMYSTCNPTDFMHPRFKEICDLMKHSFVWHRKLWEWVFITHYLLETGLLKKGNKGLVFGVGRERLPSVFANMGVKIVATDAPANIGEDKGWKKTNEYLDKVTHIYYPEIIDIDKFNSNITYKVCDMNNIQTELTDFDFNWSSCCLEHLGNLEAGMQFLINAVEKTLRIGGYAVHTTEYNLSSNEDTLKEGDAVIYRHKDIDELILRLQKRGHKVKPFKIASTNFWDFDIDSRPYTKVPHLKLMLSKYVSTSVGFIIQRGH